MAIHDYIISHNVFSTAEILEACGDNQTNKNLLSRASKAGRIEGYRGVWWRTDVSFDPLEVIAHMYPDFCLCYHSALEAMGIAHSVFPKHISFTHDGAKKVLDIRGTTCVAYPRKVGEKELFTTLRGIPCMRWKAQDVIYGCLDHPLRAGGIEEVVRSIVTYGRDPDSYARLIENAPSKALVSKLGVIAEVQGILPPSVLDEYASRVVSGSYYLADHNARYVLGNGDYRFVNRWRIYVPNDVEEWT